MKKIILILLSGSILLNLNSCTEHPYSSEIKQVAALQSQLDSLNDVFRTLDLEDAVLKGIQIKEDAEELKMYIRNYPEAMTTEIGTLIDDLKAAGKTYGTIEKGHSQLREDLFTSKKQLKNLKADLQKNILVREKVQDYMISEKKSMKVLVKNVGQMKLNSNIGVVKYDNQLELINDIKTRQN